MTYNVFGGTLNLTQPILTTLLQFVLGQLGPVLKPGTSQTCCLCCTRGKYVELDCRYFGTKVRQQHAGTYDQYVEHISMDNHRCHRRNHGRCSRPRHRRALLSEMRHKTTTVASECVRISSVCGGGLELVIACCLRST